MRIILIDGIPFREGPGCGYGRALFRCFYIADYSLPSTLYGNAQNPLPYCMQGTSSKDTAPLPKVIPPSPIQSAVIIRIGNDYGFRTQAVDKIRGKINMTLVIATMMGQLDKRDRTCKSRPFHGRLQAAFKYIPAEQGRCLCPVIQQPDRTVTVEIPGCPAPGIPDSSRSALARAKTELFKSSCPMT